MGAAGASAKGSEKQVTKARGPLHLRAPLHNMKALEARVASETDSPHSAWIPPTACVVYMPEAGQQDVSGSRPQ